MKMSLKKKLRGFAADRHEREERRHQQAFIELDRANQDMVDLRECYDKLFSVAAETANNAYEFSESLGEMGECVLEKTALNDDEESGKVLLMMGKVQLELQKFVDGYRSNIFKTITIPSESLLNELRIVEEMKRRCDHKRELYEDLITYREKGKVKGSRGECFSSHQFQVAQDEYEQEANAFVFRMKSLKQGQSHSLLTQAARHHAAQLSFFKKAFKSLEAIEPHVKMVAEQRHIDYQFCGLEDVLGDDNDDDDDDDGNDEDDSIEDDSESHDDGELSITHGLYSEVLEVSTTSMKLENVDTTAPPNTKLGAAKENLESSTGQNSFALSRETMTISQSAPLFREKKLDPAGRPRQMVPSPSRRFTSYVLPTPVEAKSLVSGKADAEMSKHKQNLWHSSPLNQNKYEKVVANEKSSGPIILDAQQVLKESNYNTKISRLPPSLSDAFSSKHFDANVASDTRKVEVQSFSDPITGKPWPNNPNLSASGRIASAEYPLPFSGSMLRTPQPPPMSMPKLSSHYSPNILSSPIISELHELPLPPAHLASKRLSNRISHTGPLISKGRELPSASITAMSSETSTLSMPPQTISRSYSIPSGGRKESTLHIPFEASQNSKLTGRISSPPLALI